MSILVIVALLLLVGAVGLRLAAQSSGGLVFLLKMGIPCLALGLLAVLISRTPADSLRNLWIDNGVSRTVAVVMCFTLLLLGWIEAAPGRVAALFWGAGLVCLCATVGLPMVQWASLLLCLFPMVFYGRAEGVKRLGIVSRHPALVLGSVLFTIGFWLLTSIDREHPGATIGMITLLCGMGGMLGWFPFPRLRSLSGDETSPAAIFAKRLFPCLTAAVLLLRMVERNPFGSSQMVLIALTATFSLLLCGARLLQEERLSSRLVLSSLSLFGFLLFVVCLGNWEAQNAKRDWAVTSNLPSAASLFSSILACEVIALLVLVCSLHALRTPSEEGDFSQSLAGAVQQRPLSGTIAVCSLASLAGIPPLAGFWWRLGLVSAYLLPHRQSNVTQVMEADQLYAMLGVVLTGLLILNSAGQLLLLRRMLFEDAFRLRSETPSMSTRWASGAGLLVLAVLTAYPLSLASILSGRQSAAAPAVAVHGRK